MTCQRCKPLQGEGLIVTAESPRATWLSERPKCAFVMEGFSDENWNCQSLEPLRSEDVGVTSWNGDQWLRVIRHPDEVGYVILAGYKSRGRIELGLVVRETESRTLALADVEAVLGALETERRA